MDDDIVKKVLPEGFRYDIIDIDLTTARTDSQFATGLMHTLLVSEIEDINANLTLKFRSTAAKGIPLKAGHTFNFKKEPFEVVYISNNAVGVGMAKLVFAYNIEIQTLLRITSDVIQFGVLQQVVNVGLAATPLPAVALADRINLELYNPVGGNTVYIGSSTVTAAPGATQGRPLLAGASWSTNVSQSVIIYAIAAIAQDINVFEGS